MNYVTVGYLYPVIVGLDGSGFPLVLAVVLSFILPSLGYLIGMKIHLQKQS